jgi:hypothetical protein
MNNIIIKEKRNMFRRGLEGLLRVGLDKTIDVLENIKNGQETENRIGKFVEKQLNTDKDVKYLMNAFGETYSIKRKYNIFIKPNIIEADMTITSYSLMYGKYPLLEADTLRELKLAMTSVTLAKTQAMEDSVENALYSEKEY